MGTFNECISTTADVCSVGTTGRTVTRWPPIPNLTETCGWAKGIGVSRTGGGGEPIGKNYIKINYEYIWKIHITCTCNVLCTCTCTCILLPRL